MEFDYDPKDAEPKLLSEGEYDAEIINVEQATAKTSGNAMLKLTVKVWNTDGSTSLVSDYIVTPSTLWKYKQIAEAIGRGDDFKAKKLKPQDIKGALLRVGVVVRKQEGYDDSNGIKKYLAQAPAKSREPGMDDDDINF